MSERDFGLTQTCVSGLLSLEPEDIKSLGLGAIWNYSKITGLPWFDMGTKGPSNQGLRASGLRGPEPKC